MINVVERYSRVIRRKQKFHYETCSDRSVIIETKETQCVCVCFQYKVSAGNEKLLRGLTLLPY